MYVTPPFTTLQSAMCSNTTSVTQSRHVLQNYHADTEQCVSSSIRTIKTVFRWSVGASTLYAVSPVESTGLTAYLYLYVAYLVIVGGLGLAQVKIMTMTGENNYLEIVMLVTMGTMIMTKKMTMMMTMIMVKGKVWLV